MRTWLIVGLLLCPAAAPGQELDQPDQRPRRARRDRMQVLREKALELIQATQALGDWDEHYEYMVDAAERVFERHGWDSESDLFALEVGREVGAIPPWNMLERHDRFMEMVGDRYLLDEEQMASLQGRLIRMNVELFSRHSDRIMQYAVEAIETRAAGEPFTPEQVARWTTLAEPVFQDVRGSLNAAATDFMRELDPEQRELVEQDMAAANRRMSDIERMGQKWKRGQWDPHDWGMEQDPIQNPGGDASGTAASEEAGSRPAEREASAGAEPTDLAEAEGRADESARPAGGPKADDVWARYVRAFIRKYDLNDEQQQRAWLICRDARQRDEVFERRYQRQMEVLRAKSADRDGDKTGAAMRTRTEKRQAELERLFNLFKRRLERLPTRAQRRSAEPGEIETPTSSAGESSPTPTPQE